MSSLLQSITARTRLRYTYPNLLQQQQARSLWWIAGLTLVLLTPYILYVPFARFSPQQLVLNLSNLTFLGLSLVAVLVLLQRGRLTAASLTYIVMLFLIISAGYILRQTPTTLIAFSVPLIAAGMLLNWRGMVVLIGATGLVLIVALALSALGVTNNTSTFPATSELILITLLVLAVDAIILATFAGSQRNILEDNFRLTQELRSSANITLSIANIASVDEMLTRVADLIRDQLGYYHVQLFLVDPKTQLLVQRTATTTIQMRGEVLQRRLLPDDPSPFNQVLHTGKLLLLTTADPADRRVEFLSATQSELILPLLHNQNLMGVLDVHSAEPNGFAEYDVEMLMALSAQVALVIQNTNLLNLMQDLSQTREQLAEQVREANREIEILSRELSGRVWSRYLQNRTDGVLGFDWQNGKITPNTAFTAGLESGLNSLSPTLRAEQNEQILTIPIVLRGQPIGVMEFRTNERERWSERHIELARIIAQRMAVTLDNVRLYEQSQAVAAREQMANQVAAALQSYTDMDSLVQAAVDRFQEALGATRTSIRLGVPNEQPHKNGGRS